MAGPRETVDAEYIGMVEGDDKHRLQRIESVRILDHPVLLSQPSSGTHSSHRHRVQPPTASDSRIFAVRSFDDDHYGADTLPLLCYQSNGSTILAARSFDGDFARTGNGDPYYHSTSQQQNGLGLPPRPSRRLTSLQPNYLPPRHSIASGRPGPDPKNPRSTRGSLPPTGRGRGDRRNPPPYPRSAEADRSGSFPRAGDRPFQPRTQPRRSSSMSMISPETSDAPSSRPRLSRRNSAKNLGKVAAAKPRADSNAGKGKFSPQRSPSIHRRFDKHKIAPEVEGDVWVERIIVNGTTGRKTTYFKSVHGKVVCKEPPTGAKTIVYLEDIIDDRHGKKAPSKQKPPQLDPQPRPKETKQKDLKKNDVSKTSASDETDDETTESKTGNGGKKERIKPKRRGSFFGFMKKDRKSKADL